MEKTVIKVQRETIYEQEGVAQVHGGYGVEIHTVYVDEEKVVIYLAEEPYRIDYDAYFNDLFLLDEEWAGRFTEPRELLKEGQSKTVWQKKD